MKPSSIFLPQALKVLGLSGRVVPDVLTQAVSVEKACHVIRLLPPQMDPYAVRIFGNMCRRADAARNNQSIFLSSDCPDWEDARFNQIDSESVLILQTVFPVACRKVLITKSGLLVFARSVFIGPSLFGNRN